MLLGWNGYVPARISKSRCAEQKRNSYRCASDRPTAKARRLYYSCHGQIVRLFCPSSNEKELPHGSLLLPEKMLETKPVKTLFSLFATSPARSCQRLIDRGGRLPFFACFQQTAGIEARLVKPEKFAAAIRATVVLQHLVKG